MTCGDVRDRLDDYVDGGLPEAEFQEVELHLAACADCAAEHRLLLELLASAAELPRDRAPARDLWPGIAARLRTPAPARTYWMAGLAAAAAVLLALAFAVRPASAPPPAEVGTYAATGLPPELERAEREYERATAQLMAALEARRGALPPGAEAVLAENLRAIDAALFEVRAAVREDPANPRLNHLLASTHQRKVEMLRRVVRLTT